MCNTQLKDDFAKSYPWLYHQTRAAGGIISIPLLAQKSPAPMKTLLKIIEQGVELNIVAVREGNLMLVNEPENTSPNIKIAESIFNPHQNQGLYTETAIELFNQYIAYTENRPSRKKEFHQYFVTQQTSLLRALYMLYRGDIINQDIVLLGDDDLTAIAIALIGGFNSLTILELDERLNRFLQIKLDLLCPGKYTIIPTDLRLPVPEKLNNNMDIVMSDPSRRLYSAFLEQSQRLIKPSGHIYFFAGPSHGKPEDLFNLQKQIISNNLLITDIQPNFNLYYKDLDTLPTKHRALLNEPLKESQCISFSEFLLRFKPLDKITQ